MIDALLVKRFKFINKTQNINFKYPERILEENRCTCNRHCRIVFHQNNSRITGRVPQILKHENQHAVIDESAASVLQTQERKPPAHTHQNQVLPGPACRSRYPPAAPGQKQLATRPETLVPANLRENNRRPPGNGQPKVESPCWYRARARTG